jgi:hypothetical protein
MDILLEQLVYGSFPFWDRGYDVLARSPGCRPEWVADVLSACRRFGEAPAGAAASPGLFALRLPSGPWAVVGVEPLGFDDRGRPGALAFHALLVDPRDYRRAGSNPFAFAGALRREWSSGTSLVAVSWPVEVIPPAPSADPRTSRIVEALSRGRRVAIESAGPIDRLAIEVWAALPESARRRASVATWAFGNANRFDLVALPRLAGVEFDRTYLDPASIDAEPLPQPPATVPGRWAGLPHPARWGVLAVVLAGLVAASLAWWSADSPEGANTSMGHGLMEAPAPIGPEERARIVANLVDLADRFELGGSNDPAALMARISSQLHYRGPTLSRLELDRLAAEGDPDRDRALGWHGRLTGTFADDRPLPDDFATLPLDRQLERLAWSFHLDPSTPPVAVPGALLEALWREGPIRPTPLAARYPPLTDYARFLGKLPRRPEK